jgi:hypothetical protein
MSSPVATVPRQDSAWPQGFADQAMRWHQSTP